MRRSARTLACVTDEVNARAVWRLQLCGIREAFAKICFVAWPDVGGRPSLYEGMLSGTHAEWYHHPVGIHTENGPDQAWPEHCELLGGRLHE